MIRSRTLLSKRDIDRRNHQIRTCLQDRWGYNMSCRLNKPPAQYNTWYLRSILPRCNMPLHTQYQCRSCNRLDRPRY